MPNRLSNSVPRWREIKLNAASENFMIRAVFSMRILFAVIRALTNKILRFRRWC